MKLLFYFKYIDVFSVEFNATIFSQKEYKTFYGSILTIIFFVLVVYKLEIILSQAITKSNFTVLEEKDILSGKNQIISSFYITACAGPNDNNTFIFLPLITENGSEIPVKYNETVSKKIGEHCYSYNLSDSIISAGTTQSGFVDGLKSFQSIIFEDVSEVKTDGLTFFIDETFIKRSDYYSPLNSKNFKIIVDGISENSQLLSIYLQTIQVKHKNSYSFGFIKYEPISSYNYTSYYSNTLTTSYNFGIEDIFQTMALVVYHSDWIITYTFSGFELDSAISELGGYINIWFMMLSLIGKILNNYLFQKHILREINKGINYDNLLNNKKKETSKNKNLKFAKSIDIRHIYKERNSFGGINDINDNNYNRIKLPVSSTTNFSYLPINPSNITDQYDSKVIIRASNKKLINPIPIKEPIEEKNGKINEETFKLYKRECDKIYDEINNEDELYNSLFIPEISDTEKENVRKKINERLFEKTMDFSNLYLIFKELKLLELLILKPDDAKFFNEYKNKFMDFTKLMILVDNKNIQEKIFSSRLYKEYALNKCII